MPWNFLRKIFILLLPLLIVASRPGQASTITNPGVIIMLQGGNATLSWNGTQVGIANIEHSTDLTTWSPLSQNNTAGLFRHAVGNSPKGFYRMNWIPRGDCAICRGAFERELFITPQIASANPSASLPGGFTINGFVAGGTLYFDNLNISAPTSVRTWVLLDHRTNPTWFGLITQSFPNFSAKTKYRFTHPNGTCYEGTIPPDTSPDFATGLILMTPINHD